MLGIEHASIRCSSHTESEVVPMVGFSAAWKTGTWTDFWAAISGNCATSCVSDSAVISRVGSSTISTTGT